MYGREEGGQSVQGLLTNRHKVEKRNGMNIKRFLSDKWQQITVAVMAVAVFCFWCFLYPFIPVVREMSQLFLWTGDYLAERLVLPGGLAQYLGEMVSQFFLNPVNAGLSYAILFVITQGLAYKLVLLSFPSVKAVCRFALSLLPPVLLWYIAMLPHIPLTPTMALVMVMGAGCRIMASASRLSRPARLGVLCTAIPVMYWLAGPVAVLLVLCCLRWIPVTLTLYAACVIASSYLTPYPLGQVAKGIDYDWSGMKQMGTFEEMECDMLLRQRDWPGILERFRHPESPAVRSAVLLAARQTGQMSQQEFTNSMVVPRNRQGEQPTVFNIGPSYMIVNYGSLSSAFMVSDIAYQLYWTNISQRVSFDAMEYIPNYNKSGRAIRRLAEACIITRQYDVAKKYLGILEHTLFYHEWARSMLPLTDNPQLITNYPFMKKAQECYDDTEDVFFF